MSIDLPAGSPPARVAFYNDPKVRSIAYQVALCAIVGFLVFGAASNAIDNLRARAYRLRLWLLEHTAGFDISQTLIPFNSPIFELWPRLLGRLAQHAAGRRPRHRVRDHPRLHHRHRAAVEELAGRQGCDRLRRDHPQYPAAAAIAVLVQRRAQGAAGDPRQPRHSRAASISTIADCSCRCRFSKAALALCWPRSPSA